jgi:hypothetical protein
VASYVTICLGDIVQSKHVLMGLYDSYFKFKEQSERSKARPGKQKLPAALADLIGEDDDIDFAS